MTDMGAAERRLEQAILRLEAALEARPGAAPLAAVAAPSTAANDSQKRQEIRDVSKRLDSAINRLRQALGE
ncbi:MAG: hypothetical protein AB1781_10490 [Pseudomonadota bacterium]